MSIVPVDIAAAQADETKKGERIPEPCIVVIFGASGDLTKRKLLPALYHLEQAGLLDDALRHGAQIIERGGIAPVLAAMAGILIILAILAAAISENSDKIIPLKKDEEAAH